MAAPLPPTCSAALYPHALMEFVLGLSLWVGPGWRAFAAATHPGHRHAWRKRYNMNPSIWAGVVLASLYLLLICVVAVVGAAHPDAARRADAQKVLERLLTWRRGSG